METITTNRIFKEINSEHDIICVQEVSVVSVVVDEYHKRCRVIFGINDANYESDYFETIEEAIQFRDKIMVVGI